MTLVDISSSTVFDRDVVHEDCAFIADAVDVRRFTNHQAAVIDAWLHLADIIAHDEKNVWFLLLRGRLRTCRDNRGGACEQTEPEPSSHFHGCLL